MPTNEEIWEARGQKWGNRLTAHPLLWGIGGLVALIVTVAVLGFVIGWFNTAASIVSPQNVKTQYHAVIEDYESLKAEAANACAVKDAARNESSPTFLEDPAIAYEAKYRQTAIDYNRRQKNIFEAGIVGPGGYPKEAPTLTEMQAQVC